MAIGAPTVSGVWPYPNDTDVILNPTIRVELVGPSLVDPRSFGEHSFALYGPGDVVLETGPGTILNSGLEDAPYPLLDGPLRRDRVAGSYALYTSGSSILSGVITLGNLGTSGAITYATFRPSTALAPNTEYAVVLLGDDGLEWSSSAIKFPGVTSWTSDPTFSLRGVQRVAVLPPASALYDGVLYVVDSGGNADILVVCLSNGFTYEWFAIATGDLGTPDPITSGVLAADGIITVVNSYSRTTQTSLYNALTGYNDTFSIAITSGTNGITEDLHFSWSKYSSPGDYPTINDTGQTHNLGDGLVLKFAGQFTVGSVYTLDTYIPKELVNSYVWRFNTGELNLSVPPSEPQNPTLIIDKTGDGLVVSSTSIAQLAMINALPYDNAYGVHTGLSKIQLEFNKPLLSGCITVDDISILASPFLNLPALSGTGRIVPTSIEFSGVYLNIYV